MKQVTVGAEEDSAAERAEEQKYLDGAYLHLAAMGERTSRAAEDAAARASADWNAEVARARLADRLTSLTDDSRPLCFGRIDEDGGSAAWYIGRRHVEDEVGEPVVVDWRAPVAVPFYRATYLDPQGLSLRRRFIVDGRSILDLLDERFDDPEAGALAAAAGLPDPLLAELGRARSGPMRDIVATIAAEQDRIIRAPLERPLFVQGGPGTGKTAVGLHRAAFLLYEHRGALTRQGVLVIGPNRRFLVYISDVLPSLGEVAVVQTTLAGLVPGVEVEADDTPEAATLKGDLRMADVLARAAVDGVSAPADPLVADTRWGTVRFSPDEVAELVDAALSSGGPVGLRRSRFRRAVARRAAAELTERRRPTVVSGDDVAADLRGDRPFQKALDAIWPARGAATLVRSLLGRGALLARAAEGVLSPDEVELLQRRPAARGRWTAADVALVDEAAAVLGDPPRRYGHIVVDEAQDLSSMEWRMVGRRSADGRSLTVLGDLAQATAPGAARRWEEAIAALGHPVDSTVERLSVGYRVPRPIMDYANRLLASMAPDLSPTESVRPWGDPPVVARVAGDGLVDEIASRARAAQAEGHSVAVIAEPALAAAAQRGLPASVTVLEPPESKGLEFDVVVVADPTAIYGMAGGPGLLYIALTRAVQQLHVLHTGELPPPLA